MKTNGYLFFIILFITVPFASSGEEFIVFGPGIHSDSTTEIIWMEQAPTGIIVVTREENEKDINGAELELFGIPSNVVDAEAPSIAITWILSEKEESLIDRSLFGPKIFDIQGDELTDFDFELNEGWVYSIGFGFINIRNYPWIWHPKLKWLFTSQNKIINKRNSYWFWSNELGWFWTQREIFPLVWKADVKDWRLLRIQ